MNIEAIHYEHQATVEAAWRAHARALHLGTLLLEVRQELGPVYKYGPNSRDGGYMEKFAWPIAVVALGIAFMIIFRNPVGKLIERIRRIGKSGLSIAEGDLQESGQHTGPSSADELLNALNSVTLQEQEQRLLADLDSRKITDPKERERVLVRYLAGTQIAYQFESISPTIWASQVALLQSVNTQEQGSPLEDLRPFHEIPLSKFPEWRETYPIEAYIGFLTAQQLLIEEGGRFRITNRGRDFLVYLVHRKHTGSQVL